MTQSHISDTAKPLFFLDKMGKKIIKLIEWLVCTVWNYTCPKTLLATFQNILTGFQITQNGQLITL